MTYYSYILIHKIQKANMKLVDRIMDEKGNTILLENLQKYLHHHMVKLINMETLKVRKLSSAEPTIIIKQVK